MFIKQNILSLLFIKVRIASILFLLLCWYIVGKFKCCIVQTLNSFPVLIVRNFACFDKQSSALYSRGCAQWRSVHKRYFCSESLFPLACLVPIVPCWARELRATIIPLRNTNNVVNLFPIVKMIIWSCSLMAIKSL